MVMHLRRRRHAEGTRRGQEQEPVVGRWRVEWRAFLLPIRDQLVQGARFEAGTGQNMRADFAALFHQTDRGIGGQLLQADRGGETGGAPAHDHHVELHCLPRGQVLGHLESSRTVEGKLGRLVATRKETAFTQRARECETTSSHERISRDEPRD